MKKLHFLALFILLFSISSLTVFAASETEDNGSLESANALSLNTTVTGAISSEDDEDWYKVTLSQDGALTIQFTHEDLKDSYRFWNVYLMDSNGLTVAGDEETCYKFSGEGTGYSLAETGLPAGVINIVTGKGSAIGNEMAGSPKIDIVSVTGSVGAGESIMAAASKNITKVSLELGGKAPAIVMKDADLERAAQWIVDSRIGNNGQICNNAERVYVQKEVKAAFTEILVKKMQAVKVGDPCADESVDMGPLVEQRALESVTEKVERAISQGAKLLCGGHRVGTKGYFYAATVLDNCRQDMDIIHEETFGPVIPLVEFETLDEVIAMANDCEYGLASSIFTKDLNVAVKACRELEFGETYINREHFEAIQGFHAGMKKSGIGGADGKHGVDEYLVTHVTYLDTWE